MALTPLGTIEKGILNGDWADVCKGFNKITGKNLTPPKAAEAFNYKTAKKTAIYSRLLEFNKDLAPANTYTLADLREMWEIYNQETDEDVQDFQASKAVTQSGENQLTIADGFRFINTKKNILPSDQKSVRVVADPQIEKIIENQNFVRPEQTRRQSKISVKCTKCKNMFQTYQSMAARISDNGELVGVCDVCKESI